PLINPRADQSHLLRRQRLGHHHSAGSARTTAARSAGTLSLSAGTTGRRIRATWSRTTGSPAAARFGRHGFFRIQLRHGQYNQTVLAVAGIDYLAVLAAFQRGFEAVQTKSALVLALAVTTEAAGFMQ